MLVIISQSLTLSTITIRICSKPCSRCLHFELCFFLQQPAIDTPSPKTVFKAWKEKFHLLSTKREVYRCFCGVRAHHPFPTTLTLSSSGTPGMPEVTTDYQTLFVLLLPQCGKTYRVQLGHTAEQETYEQL